MKRNKKIIIMIFLAFIFLLFSIGYSINLSNIKINGYSNILSSSFDIHFENITYNNENVFVNSSLGDFNATIDENDNTIVNYSISLPKPGDFYEFTVDVVNNGTINSMINIISSNIILDDNIEESLPNYLKYKLTYILL